jgi:hypothetical protein
MVPRLAKYGWLRRTKARRDAALAMIQSERTAAAFSGKWVLRYDPPAGGATGPLVTGIEHAVRAPSTAAISMRSLIHRLSISSRRKLTSILLAVAIFASLSVLTALVLGRPVINGVLNAIIVGTSVGFFEQFYVQSGRGRWLRSMHPLKSILIYTLVVVATFLLSILLIRPQSPASGSRFGGFFRKVIDSAFVLAEW